MPRCARATPTTSQRVFNDFLGDKTWYICALWPVYRTRQPQMCRSSRAALQPPCPVTPHCTRAEIRAPGGKCIFGCLERRGGRGRGGGLFAGAPRRSTLGITAFTALANALGRLPTSTAPCVPSPVRVKHTCITSFGVCACVLDTCCGRCPEPRRLSYLAMGKLPQNRHPSLPHLKQFHWSLHICLSSRPRHAHMSRLARLRADLYDACPPAAEGAGGNNARATPAMCTNPSPEQVHICLMSVNARCKVPGRASNGPFRAVLAAEGRSPAVRGPQMARLPHHRHKFGSRQDLSH